MLRTINWTHLERSIALFNGISKWVILQAAVDDIALVISELVKEDSETLNYNRVVAKSEFRMLYGRNKMLLHDNIDLISHT